MTDSYRLRVEEMVRVMRRAGARTFLLTLSQNFADWPPVVSAHRPGMRPDEKAAWRAAVRRGDALAAHADLLAARVRGRLRVDGRRPVP
jgi:hypothetical protein